MRALVTGATGLIGAHLVRCLTEAGHDVIALVRPTSRREPLDGLPVTCVAAELPHLRPEADAAFTGCDVVFHTAALFAYGGSASQHDLAVAGTDAVLRACARHGVRRAVVTSSSVVFGYSNDRGVLSESATLPEHADDPPYVRAKRAQHRLALQLGQQLRIDVRLACPTMTIGPTWSQLGPSNGMIVGYLADPFGCTWPGGCNLVAASDVAAGHRLIADCGTAGESYLLGAQNLTWRDVHTAIAELAGVAPPRVTLNHTQAFLAATAEELRAAFGRRTVLSTREQAAMVGRYYWYSHAKAAAFGYTPVSARAALTETIAWLAASPHISRELRTGMRLAAEIHRYRADRERCPS